MLSSSMACLPSNPEEERTTLCVGSATSSEKELWEGQDSSVVQTEDSKFKRFLTVAMAELGEARANLVTTEDKLQTAQGEVQSIQTRLRENEERMASAEAKLEWFRKKFFGASSEKIPRTDLKKLLESFAELFGWEVPEEPDQFTRALDYFSAQVPGTVRDEHHLLY